MVELSAYERKALEEIERFKNPRRTFLTGISEAVGGSLEKVTSAVLDNPIGEAFGKVVEGLVSLLNDGMSWSVREDAIFEEFREKGFPQVKGHTDIRSLDLEAVDRVVGLLDTKYKAIALAEGTGAGLLGAAAIAVSIPALVGLALRAAGEYATYYGFDVAVPGERAFVLTMLAASSSNTSEARKGALGDMSQIAKVVANERAIDQVHELVGTQAIKKLAEALGLRLTKAKLAQIVPVAGALVGGGYNAWFIGSVTESAYHLYRERFLVRKYGTEVAVIVQADPPESSKKGGGEEKRGNASSAEASSEEKPQSTS